MNNCLKIDHILKIKRLYKRKQSNIKDVKICWRTYNHNDIPSWNLLQATHIYSVQAWPIHPIHPCPLLTKPYAFAHIVYSRFFLLYCFMFRRHISIFQFNCLVFWELLRLYSSNSSKGNVGKATAVWLGLWLVSGRKVE